MWSPLNGQNITNEGTDFWFAYTEMFDKASAVYEAHITSRTNASGTIIIPGSPSINFTVAPNKITTVLLPASIMYNSNNDLISNNTVHIISDTLVSVFATTIHLYRSEASLILPTRALGSQYIISTKPSESSMYFGAFVVVAPHDSCTIKITSPITIPGTNCIANTPYTVNLDSGECYQIKATGIGLDLTGTIVEAANGTDVFSIYSGHSFLKLLSTNNRDPLYEVEYPINSWGKEYIVPPIKSVAFSQYQVMAMHDNTIIYVNGDSVSMLNMGEIYEDTLVDPEVVIGSRPIKVVQFMPSSNATAPSYGDPSMAGINANEQMFLKTITFSQHPGINLDSNFVIVLTRTDETNMVQLNNTTINGWKAVPYLQNYSYSTIYTDTGSHTLETSGCGFLAYAYGIGWAESYFCSAGAGFNSTNQKIAVSNISSSDSLNCTNDAISFSITGNNGTPLNAQWYFGDGNSSGLLNPVHSYTAPGVYLVSVEIEYDCSTDTLLDTVVVDYCCMSPTTNKADTLCPGQTIYAGGAWQSAPGSYFDTLTNMNGCDSVIITTLSYIEPATIGFTYSYPDPCDSSIIEFTPTSTNNIDSIEWHMGFTGGDGLTELNPIINFSDAQIYNISLSIYNACGWVDTIIPLQTHNPELLQPIIITDTLYCEGDNLSDIIALPSVGGSITWYSDSGLTSVIGTGPILTPNSNSGSTTYFVTESFGGCTSDPGIVTIYNYPLPVLEISNDTVIAAGEAVELNVYGANTYVWSTGSTTNSINVSPEQTTTYTVTGSNGPGCNTATSVTIEVMPIENVAYIPNVFSLSSTNPENNRLFVFGKNIETLELTIYNRWGEIVYQTIDTNSKNRNSDGLCCTYGEGWDGTHMNAGKPLNPAVFVYKFKVTYTKGGEYFETGNITLTK